jgi:hypothetical protein
VSGEGSIADQSSEACLRCGVGNGNRRTGVGVKACGWVNALKARWDGGRHYCYQRDGRPCGDPGRVGMAHTSGSGERL